MTILPVIERELRANARHPFTYYLRLIGAASLILACFLFGLENGFGGAIGGKLFSALHFTLFCAIWVLVPLLTADCISRERRQGTLGLLFLTHLRGVDIVAAKCLAQGLRAFTFWFAVLPVLTLPFLLGGVSWIEAVLSAAINFSAICWALSAGLIASAWSKSWLRGLLAAFVLSIGFLIALGTVAGIIVLFALVRSPVRNWQGSSDFAFVAGLGFVTHLIGNWSIYTRPTSPGQSLWVCVLLTAFSLLALLLAITLAGQKTQRSWKEQPASGLYLWWEKTFCTPMFWVGFFRHWMLRKLERNPIGWLEQRTWSARLVTWGWLAVIISLYSAMLTDRNFFRGYSGMERATAWMLAGSLALSAAGSFRRERESGVLELLLVSPLEENDIISGRLRGLWMQFLPAFGLLLGVWIYVGSLTSEVEDYGAIFFHAITFMTLPVIGLYYSLRCRSFFSAFLASLAMGLLVPIVLAAFLRSSLWLYADVNMPGTWELRLSGGAAFAQMVVAALCAIALHRRLSQRAFPFTQEAAR